MGARKTHDLCVVTGSYQTRDGETKNRYQTIGALMEGDRGPFIILEPWFNPAGIPHEAGRGIMVSCFEPREEGRQAPQQRPSGRPNRGDFTDDIPFGGDGR